MNTYTIPVVWQMRGNIVVEAKSLEKAIEIALDSNTPLPSDDASYIENSIEVDAENPFMTENKY